ncbi:helix-turn-helix transcriptional regulator [Pullulanibacillus sp. KACC 23026]|uniref:helix-turn-helix domain-containing protein n=1 Tax=Pullulanibacillus sp. KACC 23026 TaxID=3028315 RepID=UPI0023B00729|nr:helix-turn-helix transcriptional regulator [Pullulanibacillus sp. KACC 23026]WEG12856.1 helix-turn-helix transcriptional regulator [Pullulanibacillus sp. KACC 23026]
MLERLSVLRKERQWSQQETADKLGIAKSTYAGYESGYREPSLHSLLQIANLFQTTVDYLLGAKEAEAIIDITSLINNHSHKLSIDGKRLSNDELIDFVSFVRAKRRLKEKELIEEESILEEN